MAPSNKIFIDIEVSVNATVEKVWKCWTSPSSIIKWNHASPDWHTPKAENDLQPGGKFNFRMEAKDGTFGFDFNGVYDQVSDFELISYTIEGGRKVKINFISNGNNTIINQSFEAETENSIELQKNGWQNILDNFKNYVETN